ncbi:putative carotenoid cleavage dioxygenase 1 [Rosellinia necatrix]|uniref:Putative carotenoid cleavage dioxygenase 1 n=1 Tax=Rosellinia necatrix TaxID=77044 RepID=A0A1S7UJ17_ROSNE|nr:putative carotenoid cleavage dioxygenase 1 [Rosellinia necatrix]
MPAVTDVVRTKESAVLDHEEEDFEDVVKNKLAGKFEEWPNEAGFEGLTEVRGPIELKVTGFLPSWAAGSLYRTGPGGYTVDGTPKGTFKTTHWFDGFAHTHKFEIIADPDDPKKPIRVRYSSRHQAKDYVDAIRKTGRVPGLSFGQRQDPCIGIFSKIMSVFRREDPIPTPSSANVCVTVHADLPGLPPNPEPKSSGHKGGARALYLATDASIIQQISPETLEPIGLARQHTIHPLLKGPLSSAHAQRDPETGDVFNFNLDMGRCATYRIFRVRAASGKADILATIVMPGLKPAYIHSFFLSHSFVILCIPSSHLGCMGISVPWNGNVVDAIEPFDHSRKCKWFVVDRRGGRGVVATGESPAGFFFHTVNSFEERHEKTGEIDIYSDAIEYPTTDIIRAFEMDVLLNTKVKEEQKIRNCLPRIVRHRLRIPLNKTGKIARVECEKVFEIKAPHAGELPTINPDYATRKYRYVYGLSSYGYSTLHDLIVKTDLSTRQTMTWRGPAGHTPGEAIFVPRPKQPGSENEEDDGVLLSVVLDGFDKTSYLVCLDAKNMKELGRATFSPNINTAQVKIHRVSYCVSSTYRDRHDFEVSFLPAKFFTAAWNAHFAQIERQVHVSNATNERRLPCTPWRAAWCRGRRCRRTAPWTATGRGGGGLGHLPAVAVAVAVVEVRPPGSGSRGRLASPVEPTAPEVGELEVALGRSSHTRSRPAVSRRISFPPHHGAGPAPSRCSGAPGLPAGRRGRRRRGGGEEKGRPRRHVLRDPEHPDPPPAVFFCGSPLRPKEPLLRPVRPRPPRGNARPHVRSSA